ncbi:MAG TPA: hypothetical protein VFT59_02455 [Candidatus Saccharimonadales bacterium]|nr:hypothetical protein [Candidatus Saccharimonadales bacterium]
MTERTGIYLTEEDARIKISAALEKLRDRRSVGIETKDETDSGSVDYHIDNIIKAGGGMWNETVANDYLQNLEAQIGQEIEAPNTLVA